MMKVSPSSSSCNNTTDGCCHAPFSNRSKLLGGGVSFYRYFLHQRRENIANLSCLNILESLVFFHDKFKDFIEYHTRDFQSRIQRRGSEFALNLYKNDDSNLTYIISLFWDKVISKVDVGNESVDKVSEAKNLFCTACTSLYPACIAEINSSLWKYISELKDRYRELIDPESGDIRQLFKSENIKSFCGSSDSSGEEAIGVGVEMLEKFASIFDTATQKMGLEVVEPNDSAKVGVVSKVQEFCKDYEIESTFDVKVSLSKLLIKCLTLIVGRFVAYKAFHWNFLTADDKALESFFFHFTYKRGWSLTKYINQMESASDFNDFYEFFKSINSMGIPKKELASSDATLSHKNKSASICGDKHVCRHEAELLEYLCESNFYKRDKLPVTRFGTLHGISVSCQDILKSLFFFKQNFICLETMGLHSKKANKDSTLKTICKNLKSRIIKEFLPKSFSGRDELDSIFDKFHLLFVEFIYQADQSVSDCLMGLKKECEKNPEFEKDKIDLAFEGRDVPDFCFYSDERIGIKMLDSFNKIIVNKAKEFTSGENSDTSKGQCSHSLQKINLENSIDLFCKKMGLDFLKVKKCFLTLFYYTLRYVSFKFFDTSMLEKRLHNKDTSVPLLSIREGISRLRYWDIPTSCKNIFENIFKELRDDTGAESSSLAIERNFSGDSAQTSLKGKSKEKSKGKSKEKSKEKSKGKSKEKSKGKSKEKSKEKSREKSHPVSTYTNDEGAVNHIAPLGIWGSLLEPMSHGQVVDSSGKRLKDFQEIIQVEDSLSSTNTDDESANTDDESAVNHIAPLRIWGSLLEPMSHGQVVDLEGDHLASDLQDIPGDSGVINVCFTSALKREMGESGIDSENLKREMEESGIEDSENLKREIKREIDEPEIEIDEPDIDSENLKREMEESGIEDSENLKREIKREIDEPEIEIDEPGIDSEDLKIEVKEPGIDNENLKSEMEESGIEDSENLKIEVKEPGIDNENLKSEMEESGIVSENLKRRREQSVSEVENRIKIRKQNEWESESRHNVANSDPSYNLIQAQVMVDQSLRNINRVAF